MRPGFVFVGWDGVVGVTAGGRVVCAVRKLVGWVGRVCYRRPLLPAPAPVPASYAVSQAYATSGIYGVARELASVADNVTAFVNDTLSGSDLLSAPAVTSFVADVEDMRVSEGGPSCAHAAPRVPSVGLGPEGMDGWMDG